MYQIKLPEKVNMIIHTLQAHGHEAYAVGGCVRDSILGRVPDDWDITTSATPFETKRCLSVHLTQELSMERSLYY